MTSRKLTEQILVKSREFSRAILMSLKDHIVVLDKAGIILSVNQSWLKFARENEVSSLELVGEGISYLEVCRRASDDSTETAQRAIRGIESVLRGERKIFELEYPCHSPTEQRWYLMRVIPFKGEKGGVVVSHTNVSARKIAENELRKAEQKYRTVLDFTYDWEYWEAPDGSLIYVSPSCERITGYRVFEFMARPELISEIIIPDDRSIWKDHYHGLQAGSERHPSHCHFRIQHKDGSTRWIAHVCQPVFDDRAKYSGVRASNRDITKLRMVEQKVREHREMLTQQDRRETLGQLAGSIAHELNQPLTGILSDAQAGELLLEKGKLSKAETGEIFTDIIADAKRASGVLRNLRELYGDKNFKFSSLHLNSLVNDTIRILNSELVGQGVTVTTDLSENLPKIHGNRIQLQQVLMNLITNARQAMREGMNENQWISIQTLLGNDGMIEVCVEDNGPGIELELLTKIFEPLATTKETGLGMGLAISKSIIQAHGGRIWAEKSLHAGTRSHVSLPAEEEKS